MTAFKRREGIMLCQPMSERGLKRILADGPALAQPKLDGERCWVAWSEGEPLLWSSEGNPITSVPHIVEALREAAKTYSEIQNYQFDGELYHHGLSFESIHSIVGRTKNLHKNYPHIEFHIFDHKAEMAQLERIIDINSWVRELGSDYIKLVPTRTFNTLEEFDSIYADYISAGYEGAIVRHPLAIYVEKRPWTILKFKPKKTDTYRIVEACEAFSSDGTPLGRIGSLVLEDRNGNKFSAGPGTGYTMELLTMELRQDITGCWATIEYQNLTDKGVPRFGKFINISSEGAFQ